MRKIRQGGSPCFVLSKVHFGSEDHHETIDRAGFQVDIVAVDGKFKMESNSHDVIV